jgi:hypothetical protein
MHGFIVIPADGQCRLLEAARFLDDAERLARMTAAAFAARAPAHPSFARF